MTDLKQQPSLYTIEEAGRLLSLSRSTIYRLIKTDRLKTKKIGRSVRIIADSIEQFVVSG